MVFDEQTNAAFNSYLIEHPVNGSSNLLEVYDVGNRLFSRTSCFIEEGTRELAAPLTFVMDVTNKVRIVQVPTEAAQQASKRIDPSGPQPWITHEPLVPVGYTKEAAERYARAQQEQKEEASKAKKLEAENTGKAPRRKTAKLTAEEDASVSAKKVLRTTVWTRWIQGYACTDKVPVDTKEYGGKYESVLDEESIIQQVPFLNLQGTLYLSTSACKTSDGEDEGSKDLLMKRLSSTAVASDYVKTTFVAGRLMGKRIYLDVNALSVNDVVNDEDSVLLENIPVQWFKSCVSVGDRVLDLKSEKRFFGTVLYISNENTIVVQLDDGKEKQVYSLPETWNISLVQVRCSLIPYFNFWF